jgi:hypothetical protein
MHSALRVGLNQYRINLQDLSGSLKMTNQTKTKLRDRHRSAFTLHKLSNVRCLLQLTIKYRLHNNSLNLEANNRLSRLNINKLQEIKDS